jgi:hypothetical protein
MTTMSRIESIWHDIRSSQRRGPDSVCPHVYKLVAPGNGGKQQFVAEFLASNL